MRTLPITRRELLRDSGRCALALALAGGAAAWLGAPGRARADEVMAPESALEKAQAGELLLVDIRRPSEWRETGVAEPAVEITMHDAAGPRGFLKAMVSAVDGDRSAPVALICASGVRTTWASRFLAANGFSHVYNVKEGMLGRGGQSGWIRRGLPVRPCRSCES